MNEISYRELQTDDIPAVSALVMRVARAFIWGELNEKGQRVFTEFISTEAISERRGGVNYWLLALVEEGLVGIIEMRHWSHVSLFFVDGDYQKQGIGRELLRRALLTCQQKAPFIKRVTVGASLYGVPFYEKVGFASTGPRQQENGISYVPMALDLPTAPLSLREGDGHHHMP